MSQIKLDRYGISEEDYQSLKDAQFREGLTAIQRIIWVVISWLTLVFCYLEFLS